MIGPAELLVGLIILIPLALYKFANPPRKVYTLQNPTQPETVYPENNPHWFRDGVGCGLLAVAVVLVVLFLLAFALAGGA